MAVAAEEGRPIVREGPAIVTHRRPLCAVAQPRRLLKMNLQSCPILVGGTAGDALGPTCSLLPATTTPPPPPLGLSASAVTTSFFGWRSGGVGGGGVPKIRSGDKAKSRVDKIIIR